MCEWLKKKWITMCVIKCTIFTDKGLKIYQFPIDLLSALFSFWSVFTLFRSSKPTACLFLSSLLSLRFPQACRTLSSKKKILFIIPYKFKKKEARIRWSVRTSKLTLACAVQGILWILLYWFKRFSFDFYREISNGVLRRGKHRDLKAFKLSSNQNFEIDHSL